MPRFKGEGIAPDIAAAKKIAISNALKASGDINSPYSEIESQLFQFPDGTYKYIITLNVSTSTPSNQPSPPPTTQPTTTTQPTPQSTTQSSTTVTPPNSGSYIILKDKTLITIVTTGAFKQGIATNTSGEIIATGSKVRGVDDEMILEEIAVRLSSNGNLDNVDQKFIESPPQVELKPTPKQVSEERQSEERKQDTRVSVIESKSNEANIVKDNIPKDLQASGNQRLAIILVEKGEQLLASLVPILINLAIVIGIKKFGTKEETPPDSCPPENELRNILNLRNSVMTKLNDSYKITNSISSNINILQNSVSPLEILSNNINQAETLASTALNAIPSPPGIPGAALTSFASFSNLKDIIFPKITSIKSAINSFNLAISTTNGKILRIINLLNSIDKVLKKCGINENELVSLNDDLVKLEQAAIQESNIVSPYPVSSYKGFVLEIIEEQYSPTLIQIKAVAKNASGIILLQTPPSFSTDTQTLLDQIKLIIDSNPNLKAY